MINELEICPIENTVKLLNRKWTILLIRDMFSGKKHFLEFKENKPDLSNNVLSDTLKSMEKNKLVLKKVSNNSTEYHLTERGLKLNKVLYELAVFGLDEMECGDERDLEIINMFKDYYANLLNLSD
ncbi:MAG: helix-turn-helix transcriptional regulator [Methanobrevibacter sp.]|uniref:winged helix-turn-helix transcriptional regulator n=1 Tax=Methanobrevibacter sp. TaxID=66852 RepID=UPI0025D1863D|nr:helix-turn-helix domain-containing protein [Methanobrevibacter sp.]MBQ8018154.1 helix-turn-helix transcriptional regulator [Methanobrevibacter sp.]